MKYQMHTFGCKVNTYDSGLLQKNLDTFSFGQKTQTSHIHIFNTCAVTAQATKDALKEVRRLKVKDPFATIVVTGCGAQVDTEQFSAMAGVDLVVANSHKGLLPFILDQYFKGESKEKVFKSNIFRKEDLEAGGGIEPQHSRAFLKIQDGCNSFCTYCIIPFARGKSRSIPIKSLVQRVNELSAQGFNEVVLTGVHIGDYSGENSEGLENLLEAILLETTIPRIRLSSLEPVELSDRLLLLFENPRLCPHFHMSIQSANTKVLKNMKRNYGQLEVIEAFDKIQKHVPGAFVGMDVIVGFPTESKEDFEDTFKVLSESHWQKIHVFPFSERSGTKAVALPEVVPAAERRERAQQLRALSLQRYQGELLRQIGKHKRVLPLKGQGYLGESLSRDYWAVHLPELLQGELPAENRTSELEVLINGFEISPSGGHLTGQVLHQGRSL